LFAGEGHSAVNWPNALQGPEAERIGAIPDLGGSIIDTNVGQPEARAGVESSHPNKLEAAWVRPTVIFHCTNQNALIIDPANCSTVAPTCRTIRILGFGAPQNSGPFACSPSTAIVNSGSASPWSTGIKRRSIWFVT
jgi:hypothetical protein